MTVTEIDTDIDTATTQSVWLPLIDLVQAGDAVATQDYLRSLSAADQSLAVSRLDPTLATRLIQNLHADDAADLLHVLPEFQAAGVIATLQPNTAAAIVHELPSDEAADVIGNLRTSDAEAILQQLPTGEAEQVRTLSAYDATVAGGLMVQEMLRFTPEMTVGEVITELNQHADRYSDFDVRYAYVVDDQGRLVGVLPMQQLLFVKRSRPLGEIMIRNPLSLLDQTPLDNLTDFFEQHHFVGAPVVDADGVLVGVLHREAVQSGEARRAEADYRKSQGIVGGEEIRSMPAVVASSTTTELVVHQYRAEHRCRGGHRDLPRHLASGHCPGGFLADHQRHEWLLGQSGGRRQHARIVARTGPSRRALAGLEQRVFRRTDQRSGARRFGGNHRGALRRQRLSRSGRRFGFDGQHDRRGVHWWRGPVGTEKIWIRSRRGRRTLVDHGHRHVRIFSGLGIGHVAVVQTRLNHVGPKANADQSGQPATPRSRRPPRRGDVVGHRFACGAGLHARRRVDGQRRRSQRRTAMGQRRDPWVSNAAILPAQRFFHDDALSATRHGFVDLASATTDRAALGRRRVHGHSGHELGHQIRGQPFEPGFGGSND